VVDWVKEQREAEYRDKEVLQAAAAAAAAKVAEEDDEDEELIRGPWRRSSAPSSDLPRCCNESCGSASPGPDGSWTSWNSAAWSDLTVGSKAREVLMTEEELDELAHTRKLT
jgi:hypothetical protein